MTESGLLSRGALVIFVVASIMLGASYAFDTSVIANINGTKIYVANSTASSTEGNWILLTGGNVFELPEMTLKYSVQNASYTRDSSFVELNSTVGASLVKYPFENHRYYLEESDISAVFYGSPSLAGSTVDYYLISTSLTGLNNTISDTLNGNITAFENMLDAASSQGSVSADSGGDAQISLSNVASGDYMLLLLLDKGSYSDVGIPADVEYTILSSTTVEVVEFPMQVSTDVYSDTVDITIEVSNTTTCEKGYRYGAVAIDKDAYSYSLELISNGSLAETDANIDGVPVVEGFTFLGVGLKNVNVNLLQDKIGSIVGAGNGAVAFSDIKNKNSATVSMILDSSGSYTLLTGVWSYCSGEKLVSFDQTEFSIAPPAVAVGGVYSPRVTLLANSIDARLAEEFTDYMEEQGIRVYYTTAENFSDYNRQQYVIILGGQEAYQGVGGIVEEALTEEEKGDILSESVFLKKKSLYRTDGRTYIFAGKDRYATREAWREEYEEVTRQIKYNLGW